MSSSDMREETSRGQNAGNWGTLFMGPDAGRELKFDSVRWERERETRNQSAEHEYLERVREKATAQALAIVQEAQAKSRAIREEADLYAQTQQVSYATLHGQAAQMHAEAQTALREAEAIRAAAREDGFQAGLADAERRIAEHEHLRDTAASTVLHRIGEGCGLIFDAWRDELCALVRDAVEAATGFVLTSEHNAIFEQVISRSVAALENRAHIIVRVHPGNEALARSLLAGAREESGVGRFEIVPDPALEPCGVIVESDSGRVENMPETRRAIVEQALAQLILPRGEADERARDLVMAPGPELDALPEPAAPPVIEEQPEAGDMQGLEAAESDESGQDARIMITSEDAVQEVVAQDVAQEVDAREAEPMESVADAVQFRNDTSEILDTATNGTEENGPPEHATVAEKADLESQEPVDSVTGMAAETHESPDMLPDMPMSDDIEALIAEAAGVDMDDVSGHANAKAGVSSEAESAEAPGIEHTVEPDAAAPGIEAGADAPDMQDATFTDISAAEHVHADAAIDLGEDGLEEVIEEAALELVSNIEELVAEPSDPDAHSTTQEEKAAPSGKGRKRSSKTAKQADAAASDSATPGKVKKPRARKGKEDV